MSLVINIPKDTRYGDTGQGLGMIAGSLYNRRNETQDAEVISKVASGELSYSDAVIKTGGRHQDKLRMAESSYLQKNPTTDYAIPTDTGDITGLTSSRTNPGGEYRPLKELQFNKDTQGTDSSNAIKEVLAGFKENQMFQDKTPAMQSRIARNTVNAANMIGKEAKNWEDQFGKITGDNQIRLELLRPAYMDYIQGRNGKELIVNPVDAMTKARKDTEKTLKEYNKALAVNPNMSLQDFLGSGGQVPEPPPVTTTEAPGFMDGLRSLYSTMFGDSQDVGVQAPDPNVSPAVAPAPAIDANTLPEEIPPEARIQETTDAAVNYGYPIQDNEQWIDVGPNLPYVPQSLMDIAKAGDVSTAAEYYTGISGGSIPIPVAMSIIRQNMNKMPVQANVQTKVIPDPVSDAPVAAPVEPAPAIPGNTPQQQRQLSDGNVHVPGVAPVRRFQNPGDLAPKDNTFIK